MASVESDDVLRSTFAGIPNMDSYGLQFMLSWWSLFLMNWTNLRPSDHCRLWFVSIQVVGVFQCLDLLTPHILATGYVSASNELSSIYSILYKHFEWCNWAFFQNSIHGNFEKISYIFSASLLCHTSFCEVKSHKTWFFFHAYRVAKYVRFFKTQYMHMPPSKWRMQE